MNKIELNRAIAQRIDGATQKDINTILETLEMVIVDTLKADPTESVAIGKIGKFKVKDVPERTGTIMMGDRKGETYTVPAHSEITFKMSKSAKTI